MKLDKSIISKLEELSMLSLSGNERDEIFKELQKLIDMIDIVQKTKIDLEETGSLKEPVQKLRDDTAQKGLDHDEVFLNTKKRVGPYFAVPKVIKRDNE